MCPATSYWQGKIADVVGTLVNSYGVDGVYIDQIGAAQPRLCWDPSHGHPLGGGAHWVAGYKSLLANARAQAGNNAMLVTESNAEPCAPRAAVAVAVLSFSYGVCVADMGSLDSYLTLVAFGGDFAGPGAFVPAFASIYGVRDYSDSLCD